MLARSSVRRCGQAQRAGLEEAEQRAGWQRLWRALTLRGRECKTAITAMHS